jgi:hypothetical protein
MSTKSQVLRWFSALRGELMSSPRASPIVCASARRREPLNVASRSWWCWRQSSQNIFFGLSEQLLVTRHCSLLSNFLMSSLLLYVLVQANTESFSSWCTWNSFLSIQQRLIFDVCWHFLWLFLAWSRLVAMHRSDVDVKFPDAVFETLYTVWPVAFSGHFFDVRNRNSSKVETNPVCWLETSDFDMSRSGFWLILLKQLVLSLTYSFFYDCNSKQLAAPKLLIRNQSDFCLHLLGRK